MASSRPYRIKSGDYGIPITATLSDENDLTLAGATVRFKMRPAPESDSEAEPINATATIVDAEACKVLYMWLPDDTETPGVYIAEWEVTLAGGGIETFPSEGYIDVIIEPDLG